MSMGLNCAPAAGPPATMPGASFAGALPALTDVQRARAGRLGGHVRTLAAEIGERHVGRPEGLARAAEYLAAALRAEGYAVGEQAFEARGVTVRNLEAEIKGSTHADEIVVVGAHYDSAPGTPAANDNGTGVAALLEIARELKAARPARTVRLVFFANEEPPFFRTPLMGSVQYARRCAGRKENVVAMLCLETIGYYSDAEGSQRYPAPYDRFFPTRGDFLAFVSDPASKDLLTEVVGAFRTSAPFPSEGVAAPPDVAGIGFSDHWSFWQSGYRAVMATDTALFRDPMYHKPGDTSDRLDLTKLARVTDGLIGVARALGRVP